MPALKEVLEDSETRLAIVLKSGERLESYVGECANNTFEVFVAGPMAPAEPRVISYSELTEIR